MAQFPKVLIHVGRPDASKPHCDMSLLSRFIMEEPDAAIVIIVDTEEDQKAVEAKVKADLKFPQGHPGGLIISWKDDGELIDLLCSRMYGTISWRVVGNGWYVCEDGHEASATMKEPLDNCPTCKKPLTAAHFVRHNEARVEQFKVLLEKAAKLMHFDTRSGVILKQLVNPDANVLKNIPYILGCEHWQAPRLKEYVGKGKGKVALCVSAGPSLDDELDNLKRLQESCLILCVGRVYKRLRAHGIRVDYTFSCEMFEWDSAIFDDVGDVGETVLCYPGVVAPSTVKKWPGKKVCMADPQLAELLGLEVAQMGGNSVSHHQLNFACEILNADKVILVGQDLAYTKPEGTHAKESMPEKWPDEVKAQDSACHAEIVWGPCYGEGGRFHPECHRGEVIALGGTFTPTKKMEVRTSKPYQDFETLFSILISRHKKPVFNACGEGLKIGGAPYLSLSEFKG